MASRALLSSPLPAPYAASFTPAGRLASLAHSSRFVTVKSCGTVSLLFTFLHEASPSSSIMGLSDFSGKKYKLSSSSNFDEYMKALGVSFVTRQVGNNVSPVVELLIDGDQYTLKSSSTFKNTSITFKLGEEFEQETPDGRKVKATITLEGDNTLVEVQEGGDKTTKIVREFSENEIKMTLTLDSIVCTRVYALQK